MSTSSISNALRANNIKVQELSSSQKLSNAPMESVRVQENTQFAAPPAFKAYYVPQKVSAPLLDSVVSRASKRLESLPTHIELLNSQYKRTLDGPAGKPDASFYEVSSEVASEFADVHKALEYIAEKLAFASKENKSDILNKYGPIYEEFKVQLPRLEQKYESITQGYKLYTDNPPYPLS